MVSVLRFKALWSTEELLVLADPSSPAEASPPPKPPREGLPLLPLLGSLLLLLLLALPPPREGEGRLVEG